MRTLLVAAILALAGCQLNDTTVAGTVVSVAEAAPQVEREEESPLYYEPPLVPEVAWKVEVQLDNGSAVTVTTHGPRRYEPGERVRMLKDTDGELLL